MRTWFNLLISTIFLLISTSAYAVSTYVNSVPNAATASHLAANGTTCSAGQAPRGVDSSGNAVNCTKYAQLQIDTVANLTACSSGNKGLVALITDGSNATDCTAGTGSSINLCICNGTAYSLVKGAL